MDPARLGGHPAIDLLNTSFRPGDETVERLGDGAALAAWLQETGLVEPGAAALTRRLGAAGLDAAATEVRRLREWARSWLARWSERPGDDYAAEIRHLNGFLAATALRWELAETPGGRALVDRVRVATPGDLVGVAALSLARLVAEEDPHRLRRCAGATCTLWFLDRTKAGRRLYCSASGCGNRAKVAAFRRRRRDQER